MMEASGQIPMVKGEDGVWTYTTSMPSPELHTYCFMWMEYVCSIQVMYI